MRNQKEVSEALSRIAGQLKETMKGLKEDDQEQKMEEELTFEQELSSLINKFSLERGSNTPDYILAEYLIQCLKAFDCANKSRTDWHR